MLQLTVETVSKMALQGATGFRQNTSHANSITIQNHNVVVVVVVIYATASLFDAHTIRKTPP